MCTHQVITNSGFKSVVVSGEGGRVVERRSRLTCGDAFIKNNKDLKQKREHVCGQKFCDPMDTAKVVQQEKKGTESGAKSAWSLPWLGCDTLDGFIQCFWASLGEWRKSYLGLPFFFLFLF